VTYTTTTLFEELRSIALFNTANVEHRAPTPRDRKEEDDFVSQRFVPAFP
jgi:hypothetical protein